MHSSRMRAARLLPVSPSMHYSWGVSLVSSWGGGLLRGGVGQLLGGGVGVVSCLLPGGSAPGVVYSSRH